MIRKYHNHKPQTIPYTARKKRSTLNPLFYTYSNPSLVTNGVFLDFTHILTRALPKRAFSLCFMVAFILIKALPQRVFFFSIFPFWAFSLFCSNPNNYPVRKGVFLYFCPYSNQSPTLKGVFFFYIFALILTKALPKKVFFTILLLF